MSGIVTSRPCSLQKHHTRDSPIVKLTKNFVFLENIYNDFESSVDLSCPRFDPIVVNDLPRSISLLKTSDRISFRVSFQSSTRLCTLLNSFVSLSLRKMEKWVANLNHDCSARLSLLAVFSLFSSVILIFTKQFELKEHVFGTRFLLAF